MSDDEKCGWGLACHRKPGCRDFACPGHPTNKGPDRAEFLADYPGHEADQAKEQQSPDRPPDNEADQAKGQGPSPLLDHSATAALVLVAASIVAGFVVPAITGALK